MHNLDREAYDQQAEWTQPWLPHSDASKAQQKTIQALLASAASAEFGIDCFVAADAKVFTHKLVLGDRSWIASGAIVRGNVRIGADCSVNPYVHIAGQVTIGRGCRIASLASIYGFNHGISRTDIFIKDQPGTYEGVVLHEDIWVGANAVILDGVEIGAHCVIAAGAVVTKSFGEYQIIGGNPARVISSRRDK